MSCISVAVLHAVRCPLVRCAVCGLRCRAIVWPGGEVDVPSDRSLPTEQSTYVFLLAATVGIGASIVVGDVLHRRDVHWLPESGATVRQCAGHDAQSLCELAPEPLHSHACLPPPILICFAWPVWCAPTPPVCARVCARCALFADYCGVPDGWGNSTAFVLQSTRAGNVQPRVSQTAGCPVHIITTVYLRHLAGPNQVLLAAAQPIAPLGVRPGCRVFKTIFLPIIIFESGYAIQKHPFFSQVGLHSLAVL